MTLTIICAASDNGIIGANNQLPWHLPADLKRFKALTLHHPVLMGRKTYESIGKPLPERTNVVITRQKDFKAPGCQLASSLQEATQQCGPQEEIFVIGGGEIYQQALPIASKIYLTRIHQQFDGDTHLFELDPDLWRLNSEEKFAPDEKNLYPYSFLTYERNHG